MHPVQSAVVALGGVLFIALAAYVGVRIWAHDDTTEAPERLQQLEIAELGPHLAGQRVAIGGTVREVQYREPGLQVLVIASPGGSVEVPYLQTGGQIRVFQPGEMYRIEGQVFADEAGVTVVPAGSRAVVRTREADGDSVSMPEADGGADSAQSRRLLSRIDPGSFWVAVASVDMLEKAAAELASFDAPEERPGRVQPVVIRERKRYRALLGPYDTLAEALDARKDAQARVPDAWILRASVEGR